MCGDDPRHLWLSQRGPRGHPVCLARVYDGAWPSWQCAWCDRSTAGSRARENCASVRHQERESAMRWMLGGVLGALLLGMSAVADPGPYKQRLTQALGLMQQEAWQQALEAVGELEKKAALTPELARLWFIRGTLAQKLQDPDTARQAFERVWQGYPPLADYAAWEMVQYDAAHDLLSALQKLVITLAERYPFSRLLPESQLLLARTQHRLGQSATARATLERLLGDTTEYPIRSEMMTFLSQVYEDQGELVLAAQTLQRLGESYPRD